MFTVRVVFRSVVNVGRTARPYSTSPSYTHIIQTRPEPSVSLLTLNRPKYLNSLNSALISELNHALEAADADNDIGSIVITGSEKAFAAGADIKEMKDKQFSDAYGSDFLSDWSRISRIKKPVIAAVSGFALGGGCELAMLCDIIYASPTAVFGQPEIKLGVIPGAGGTQRLTRAIGKSKAMELILTGRTFNAEEAEKWGLVSKVVAPGEGQVVKDAVALAASIGEKGRLSVQAAKETVNAAYELNLPEGIRLERRVFHSLFATKDQKEGMTAFVEKRKPEFTGA